MDLLTAREALILGLSVWRPGVDSRFNPTDFVDAFFPSLDRADGNGFREVISKVVSNANNPVERLEKWADNQDVRDYFDLGRDLNQLVWYVGWISIQLVDQETRDVLLTIDQLQAVIDRLSSHRLVRDNTYFAGALASYAQFVRQLRAGVSDQSPELGCLLDGEVEIIQPRLVMLGVGIGELIGLLRDEDRQRQRSDAEKVSPRGLWIAPDESVDMLRGRVLAGERSLARVEDAPYLPIAEHSISGADDVIDALMKRLWSAKDVQSAGGTGKFLEKKLGGNNPEPIRRFASIAKNIHLTYRNPASHEASTFRCTVREAKYVLCAIHVLIDLHDEILKQQLT